MKALMKKRVWLLCEMLCIALALVLVIGSFAVFAQEATDADAENTVPADEVQVVRLVKDAPVGTRLTQNHVEIVTVKNLNVPANVITDIEAVLMMYMKEDAYAGEILNSDQISSEFVTTANSELIIKDIKRSSDDYVIVTDYVKPNTGENLAAFLQKIIDSNPNRCIYFPAGEYVIDTPLNTSSAPKDSVSILLDDGAVIKASDDWKATGDNALICIGGSKMVNDIVSVGSYYTLIGGTLDANGKANGVAISAGRETVVRNICIKNAKIGISIPRGTNNTSADIDFEDVTIIGQGKAGTIGIDIHAADNNFANIRIYDMATGVANASGGEIKSIYVTNTEKSAAIANSTVGFKGGHSRMTQCYTENCAIGFNVSARATLNDCTAVWTSTSWKNQVAFNKNKGETALSGCRAEFLVGEGVTTAFIQDKVDSGSMYVKGCSVNTADLTTPIAEELLITPMIYAD